MPDHPHFHPFGKQPSAPTQRFQAEQRKNLPFEDERDFEEHTKGHIATPEFTQIMADAGNVAWDMGRYQFLLEGEDFDSIHPSLQRQAILNMNYGLYEVIPGIWQVRGFDLSNVTFVEGETGWIVFDTATAVETARAAHAFINEHLGERPVSAVVHSHSHADHFGGVRGLVELADVRSGKIPIIAPDGFLEHAVAENVYAGNAMTRRAFYQYGLLTPASPFGHVDQAIGKNVAAGTPSLIPPTMTITQDIEEHTIDGVRMVFHSTPGTEAPAEMNTYFPDLKAFWAAENITATIHNIYTLRGALVRDALLWSKKIGEALHLFGGDAQVMFASHSWPRWGAERIQEVMRDQRDAYAHLNNRVLHLANQGVTINEIHNEYELPTSLRSAWHARSYHGSEKHNSRGVINRYLGYWDGNPATLIPLSPGESAPLFVEMMGGSEPILTRGRELFDEGHYLHAVEILNKLVYAEPDNEAAKELLADHFEQIGYQQESSSVRNSFLSGAYELRSRIPSGVPAALSGPDVLRALTTEMYFDSLGIRLDSTKVEDASFVANLNHPDTGEHFVVELSNATLTVQAGFQSPSPTVSITINRSDLEDVMLGSVTFIDQMATGVAMIDGDASGIQALFGALVDFKLTFEMLPGTAAID
ncbi:MAG: MBL fold metallo-hydrolase [Actinomycetia bacterium]|nr:MBL fold metallo-hydrolase [Actinomycetes bacterium]